MLRYIKNRLRLTLGRLHLDFLMELFLNTDFVAEFDKGTGPEATRLAKERAEEQTKDLIEHSLKRWFKQNRRIDVQPADKARWRELGVYDNLPSEGGDAEPELMPARVQLKIAGRSSKACWPTDTVFQNLPPYAKLPLPVISGGSSSWNFVTMVAMILREPWLYTVNAVRFVDSAFLKNSHAQM